MPTNAQPGNNKQIKISEYIKEIKGTGVPYHIISGQRNERLLSAVSAIKSFNK